MGLLPAVFQNSLLMQPFLKLAGVSHGDIASWQAQSLVGRILFKLHEALVAPVQQKLKQAELIHRALYLLHVAGVAFTLIVATFADTDQIALVVAGTFAVMLMRFVTRPMGIRLTIVDLLVTLFFLTAVWATAFSSYKITSLIGLSKFLVFYIGFWNCRVLFQERPRMILMMLGLLTLLGLGESLIGFYQYINHVQPLATWQDPTVNAEDQLTRIFGTLQPSNPNLLAGFLIPCIASAMGLGLYGFASNKKILGALSILVMLVILVALVVTGSRGGYLAILLMSVTTFLCLGCLLWTAAELKTHYKLKAAWLIGGIAALAGAALALTFMAPIRNRFLSIFAMREDSSNSYRLNVWASVWKMIEDNWLMGIGPGNNTFKLVYGFYMVPGYNALSAYCIFLEMWAEQGIFGLLAFLVLLSALKVRNIISMFSTLPLPQKVLTMSLYIGVVGSVIYGLFDTIWYRPSVNLLFWLFVAALSVCSEEAIADGRA